MESMPGLPTRIPEAFAYNGRRGRYLLEFTELKRQKFNQVTPLIEFVESRDPYIQPWLIARGEYRTVRFDNLLNPIGRPFGEPREVIQRENLVGFLDGRIEWTYMPTPFSYNVTTLRMIGFQPQ